MVHIPRYHDNASLLSWPIPTDPNILEHHKYAITERILLFSPPNFKQNSQSLALLRLTTYNERSPFIVHHVQPPSYYDDGNVSIVSASATNTQLTSPQAISNLSPRMRFVTIFLNIYTSNKALARSRVTPSHRIIWLSMQSNTI